MLFTAYTAHATSCLHHRHTDDLAFVITHIIESYADNSTLYLRLDIMYRMQDQSSSTVGEWLKGKDLLINVSKLEVFQFVTAAQL